MKDEGKTASYNALLTAYFFSHVVAAAKYLMPTRFEQTFSDVHLDLLCVVKPGQVIKEADIAPRGVGKTMIGEFLVMHMLLHHPDYEAMGFDPFDCIIVFGEADGAMERLANIRNELNANPEIHRLYRPLLVQESAEVLKTRHGGVIVAKTRGARIRGVNVYGKRPNFLYVSDIQKSANMPSVIQRTRQMEWWEQDVSLLGTATRPVSVFIEGTRLHKDAILASVHDSGAYTGHTYKAVQEWATRQDLWSEWLKLYVDKSNPNRRNTARQFFLEREAEMLEGVKVLWPDGLSYYACMELIAINGKPAFDKEMQHEDTDASRILRMADATWFDVTAEGLLRDDNRLVRWEDFAGGTIFLDWAGGQDRIENCYAAAAVLLWEKFPTSAELNSYFVDCYLNREPLGKEIAACFDLYKKWSRFRFRLGIEDRAGIIGTSIQDAFTAEQKRREAVDDPSDLFLELIPHTENKIDRITAAFGAAIPNGWLAFNRSLSVEVQNQFKYFGTHDYLDAPDAVEGAYSMPIDGYELERIQENTPDWYSKPTKGMLSL